MKNLKDYSNKMYDIKIKFKYLKKIKLFRNYNKHYYEKDKPIISDQKFDQLKKDIIELENKYKFLQDKNSPTKVVGFKPSKNINKVKHKVTILSLGNAFNEEDLKNFEKKIFNFLRLNEKNKIDYSA